MSMENCLPITIGTLLKHALKAQLQSIGNNFRNLRLARNEDIGTVARAVDITPGQLGRIESGRLDLRLGVLFDLCDYFDADLKKVVKITSIEP